MRVYRPRHLQPLAHNIVQILISDLPSVGVDQAKGSAAERDESLHWGRSWRQSQMPEVHSLDTELMMKGLGWLRTALSAMTVAERKTKTCMSGGINGDLTAAANILLLDFQSI